MLFFIFLSCHKLARPDLFRVAGGACACGHYFLLLLRTSSQSQGS
jgi:hypothetical protein